MRGEIGTAMLGEHKKDEEYGPRLKDAVPHADKYWKEEVAGSNSIWQRSKRLVFKVPHYKTGGELAALVAAKKAANRR